MTINDACEILLTWYWNSTDIFSKLFVFPYDYEAGYYDSEVILASGLLNLEHKTNRGTYHIATVCHRLEEKGYVINYRVD